MKLKTSCSSTKKPPFIQFELLRTFSLKTLTLFFESISKAPNRAGGVTAVTVAMDELELMLMTVFYFDPLLTKV